MAQIAARHEAGASPSRRADANAVAGARTFPTDPGISVLGSPIVC